MLHKLQQQIANILAMDEVLTQDGISIVVIDRGDALAIVSEKLNTGTAIAIAPPTARFNPECSTGPVSDGGINALVQVIETPVFARSQGIPSATQLAERIAWLLHSANHDDRHDDILLGCSGIAVPRDPDYLVYDITFVATGAISKPDDVDSEQ